MLANAPDLPRTVAGLYAALVAVDLGKRLRRDDRLLLAFGKHAGRPLEEVAGSDPDYLRWPLRQDFLPDFKAFVTDALAAVDD
jgi:hypothetical protein